MGKAAWAARALTLLLTPGLGACGTGADGDQPPETRSPAVAAAADSAAPGYTVADVPDGGIVRGTVRFTGDPPPARTVAVTADTAACGTTQREEPVRVARGGGLADAVVSLVDVRQGAAFAPASFPTLDQHGCRFTPHILLAPAGDSVVVLNSDPVTHNVHTAAFDNRPVNRSQPAGGTSLTLRLDTPEKVRVRCDLHPWMGAWIIVSGHPYHAITDDRGAFELTDVPAGTHTIEIWHETLGTRRQAVTVVRGAVTDVTVELEAEH